MFEWHRTHTVSAARYLYVNRTWCAKSKWRFQCEGDTVHGLNPQSLSPATVSAPQNEAMESRAGALHLPGTAH